MFHSIALFLVLVPFLAEAACPKDCDLSENGYALIKQFEGFMPYPYLDVGGKLTIGFGHLILPGEQFSPPLLGKDAHDLLVKDSATAQKGVRKMISVPIRQGQYDALVSWTYNLGTGALQKSKVREYTNQRRYGEVPAQIRRWINVNGKPVRGLRIRREAEALLYEYASE